MRCRTDVTFINLLLAQEHFPGPRLVIGDLGRNRAKDPGCCSHDGLRDYGKGDAAIPSETLTQACFVFTFSPTLISPELYSRQSNDRAHSTACRALATRTVSVTWMVVPDSVKPVARKALWLTEERRRTCLTSCAVRVKDNGNGPSAGINYGLGSKLLDTVAMSWKLFRDGDATVLSADFTTELSTTPASQSG